MNGVLHPPATAKTIRSAAAGRARGVRAWTLTEMMVVVFIIMLLIGLLAAFVGWFNRRGQESLAIMDIHTIGVALDAYQQDQGFYPYNPYTFTVSSGTVEYANARGANSNALYRALVLQPQGTLTVKRSPYLTTLRASQLSGGGAMGEATEILDPWNNAYNYDSRSPYPAVRRSPKYDLWTSGPDGFTSNRRRSDEPNDYDNDDLGTCYPR
jgi:type II secretory pathway pseudopilin PulG